MSEQLKEFLDMAREAWYVGVAFMGALVSQSFWQTAVGLRAVVNVMIGTMVSVFSAPAMAYALVYNWPDLANGREAIAGALYFWCGLLGMHLIPLAAKLVESINVRK